MKYIIMCGGWACNADKPKHFFEYCNEPIIVRTIRLLKECGVVDIAITTSPNKVNKFSNLGVEVIPYESNNIPFIWLDAFYPTSEPVCYIFGDVVFSYEAIKTIVNKETDDIEFFASAPPFSNKYPKTYAEPFAFKVVNQKRFRECIDIANDYDRQRIWQRQPIAWELWQVIKHTQPNIIVYTNYTVINDYTCDIDYEYEMRQWRNI